MATIENQEQWKCRSYDQRFEIRGKRDAHHRREYQGVSMGIIETSGNGRMERAIGEKFVCFYGIKFWHIWSLKWYREGCYTTITMIEGGENSSEYEEDMFP
jgi:hypothetical protein